jgi:putative ABC transport system ATP-binding protein
MSVSGIELRGVTKTYGSGATAYQALRGVDMSARPGEFIMLSGPSGSGKTTLLSIIGCVLRPSSGEVRLFDRDVSKAKESTLPALRLAYVGFVFQGHNLIASSTACDNVALPLELRGRSRRQARCQAADLLARVGLGHRLHNKPRELSGGECQRVAIARALVGSPPLVLADEPTAALDATNGRKITELLRTLAKEHGHTVIVVTHDNRIFDLADRIVRIEDGLIQSEAS